MGGSQASEARSWSDTPPQAANHRQDKGQEKGRLPVTGGIMGSLISYYGNYQAPDNRFDKLSLVGVWGKLSGGAALCTGGG